MVWEKVKNSCVFFSTGAANKGDIHDMVKIMACSDFYEDELIVMPAQEQISIQLMPHIFL